VIYILDLALRIGLGLWRHIFDLLFLGGYLISWRLTFKKVIWGVLKRYPKVPLDWQDITSSMGLATIASCFWPLVMIYMLALFYGEHHSPMEVAKKLGGRPPKDIENRLIVENIMRLDKELGISSAKDLDVPYQNIIDA